MINELEWENNVAIPCYKINKIIVKPNKFKEIVLNKRRSNLTNTIFKINNQVIKSVPFRRASWYINRWLA